MLEDFPAGRIENDEFMRQAGGDEQPAVGLNASAFGRMPGSPICVPAGVTSWLTGVTSVSPLRPTGAVVVEKLPAKTLPEPKQTSATRPMRTKSRIFISDDDGQKLSAAASHVPVNLFHRRIEPFVENEIFADVIVD